MRLIPLAFSDTGPVKIKYSKVDKSGFADVISVTAEGVSGKYKFFVKIKSPDKGCDQIGIPPGSDVMRKKYLIKLEGNNIGYTYFERCQSPMGVVIGDIQFNDIESGYELFIKYCIEHNIQVNAHDEVHRFIDIQDIEQLTVINEIGADIKGQRVALRGFDTDGFEIIISGIPHPFYGKEFPYHGEEYDNQFK